MTCARARFRKRVRVRVANRRRVSDFEKEKNRSLFVVVSRREEEVVNHPELLQHTANLLDNKNGFKGKNLTARE